MDKALVIERARALANAGKLEDAIDVILEFLEPYRQNYYPIYNKSIQLKARLLRADRQLVMGLISTDGVERVQEDTEQELYALLNELDEPEQLTPVKKERTPRFPIIVGVSAIGITLVAMLFLGYQYWNGAFASKSDGFCPNYEEGILATSLLAPYMDDPTVSKHFCDSLVAWSAGANFAAGHHFLRALPDSLVVDSIVDVTRLEAICKPDLLIWDDGARDTLRLNYDFGGTNDFFVFHLLSPGVQKGLDSVPTYSSIPTYGRFAAVSGQILLGVLASQAEELESANALLVTAKDDASNLGLNLLKQLQLAANYRLQGETALALGVYDTILNRQPNYSFAHVNKGTLHWQKREFETAIHAFSKAIVVNPNHIVAHYARARTFVNMGILKQAEMDLQKADTILGQLDSVTLTRSMAGVKRSVDQLLIETSRQKQGVWQSIRKAKQVLSDRPKDVANLNALAKYYLQIGEDQDAIKQLKKIKDIHTPTQAILDARVWALEIQPSPDKAQQKVLKQLRKWISTDS